MLKFQAFFKICQTLSFLKLNLKKLAFVATLYLNDFQDYLKFFQVFKIISICSFLLNIKLELIYCLKYFNNIVKILQAYLNVLFFLNNLILN